LIHLRVGRPSSRAAENGQREINKISTDTPV
jgi:hypothetical protein